MKPLTSKKFRGARMCRRLPTSRSLRFARLTVFLGLISPGASFAWIYTASGFPAPTVFLQVGDGIPAANAGYSTGSFYTYKNSTINKVTFDFTVATSTPGYANSSNMGMGAVTGKTDSTQVNNYPGLASCNPSAGQVFINAFLVAGGSAHAGSTARLEVTAPLNLTNGVASIPFNKISWVSVNGGDIPSGTFTGGATQLLYTVTSNRYVQNCMAFSYANDTVPLGGTYTGRVTYTLTYP